MNWNSILIIAELKDWIDQFDDDTTAYFSFYEMVQTLKEDLRVTEKADVAYWQKASEQLAISH